MSSGRNDFGWGVILQETFDTGIFKFMKNGNYAKKLSLLNGKGLGFITVTDWKLKRPPKKDEEFLI
jgi:hypothetical protein